MPKYKAVIFDLDDTLLESRARKWAQHTYVAKKFYNIDLTEDILRKHWGKPLSEMISILYQNSDTSQNMARQYLREVRQDFLKKAYEGSLSIVNKLLKNGIEVGVLSSTFRSNVEEDLVALGFPVDKFLFLQGEDDTEVHKPDPRVFYPAFKKLKEKNIDKEEAVYVGDSIHDLQATYGAGIDFIAVTTGLYNEEDFKKAGAKVIIKDIKEAEKILC